MLRSLRKTPKSSTLLVRVTAVLKQHIRRGDHLVAGYSGGIDSTVLLDLLHRASKRAGFNLMALHVNHQINPRAARWAAFCRAVCRVYGIPCKVMRVTVPQGNSLEAQARNARYRAFAALPVDFVVLAHNQDDQAETLLLQLLRGAGVKGLSAMPEVRAAVGPIHRSSLIPYPSSLQTSLVHNPSILRPLLNVPRSEIEEYARLRKLQWVEDDSNADVGFDRNFIRHQVMPVIAQRYPAYRETFARCSRNLAEAAQLLDELAATDASPAEERLTIAGLSSMSVPRAKNAVRYFLAQRGVIMPNAVRLHEYVRQIRDAVRRERTALDLGSHELLQFAGALYLVAKKALPCAGYTRLWNGESTLELPELGGTLTMKKSRGAGISLARLQAAPVHIRARQGGERFRPAAGRPHRDLKKLFQEAHLPPWMRSSLPLIYSGTTLVHVPGIGTDPEYLARQKESGVEPHWTGSLSG